MTPEAVLIHCYQAGLSLRLEGERVAYSGTPEAVAALLPLMAEHKEGIRQVLSSVPPEIEERIAGLVACGEFDEQDAGAVRAGYHRCPEEWEFILGCCERTAADRERSEPHPSGSHPWSLSNALREQKSC